MKLYSSKTVLSNDLQSLKEQGKVIGFVPTMGALHQGHLSLIQRSVNECDITVVSIFVNPTQFNNPNDLKNYPRTQEKDLQMLSENGCSMAFVPSVDEMYPEPDHRQFDFGLLDKVMEGEHRKGHFNGVAQVVSKLFDIVAPHKAYFGLKDFQQVAVINEMKRQMGYPVEIVTCPILREEDGLAMSSRNTLLSPEQRSNAPLIAQTLFKAVDRAGETSVAELLKWVCEQINLNPFLEVEYFDIVDNNTLQSVSNWAEKGNKTGCIAVHCGTVRLIDNVQF